MKRDKAIDLAVIALREKQKPIKTYWARYEKEPKVRFELKSRHKRYVDIETAIEIFEEMKIE